MAYSPTISVLFLVILASIACCCNGFVMTKGGGIRYKLMPSTITTNLSPLQNVPSSSRTKASNTEGTLSPLQAMRNKDEVSENGDKKKLSPATYVIAPFVFIFGLDIVLNILVVTKRSLEVALTGEYTVWTPWQ